MTKAQGCKRPLTLVLLAFLPSVFEFLPSCRPAVLPCYGTNVNFTCAVIDFVTPSIEPPTGWACVVTRT